MDRFESMAAFVAVCEAGGFSAAARRLGTPIATISRRVADLEQQLQVQLLTRTTRAVALTEIGQNYFETARRLLEELGEAERLATGEYRAPKGELAAAAPIVLGRVYLTPIVTAFLSAYPEVDVDLRLADRMVNIAEEGIDVALRVGDLPDSGQIAVRVGEIRHIVCAAPDYLARRGTPSSLDELAAHDCVTFTGLESAREWVFRRAGQVTRLPVRSRFAVTTAEAAVDAAVAGAGITRVLCYQASGPILDGRLELILRDHEPPPLPVHLIYAGGRVMPQKLRAFLDFVVPRLKPRLVFDP